jgi:hypothetical protein
VSDNNLDFVGFLETKKETSVDFFLNYVHKDFAWHALLAKGTAGGILVGLNERKFKVIAYKIWVFSVAIIVKNC